MQNQQKTGNRNMSNFFAFLKQCLVSWCLRERIVTIGELFSGSNPQQVQIPGPDGELKFTAEGSTFRLVQTPTGWSPVKRVLQTVPFAAWELVVAGQDPLVAADEHLIMAARGEVHMKDLQVGELVHTTFGLQPVLSIKSLDHTEVMYDLELDDDAHVFYTNGILSHNTTVVAMYILWFSLFNSDKLCIIASKAMNHAVEIMSRIKYAYEELPGWLKAGCKFYNRTSIEFDNGSKIKSEATSEKTGRGSSPSILFIDEIAFISKRIQDELWASLAPALSTGGKFILTSTPNGDADLFAQVWRGANSKQNSFIPLQAMWWQHPQRGEEYYKEMLGKLGELKTRQELGCEFLSSDALLINSMRLNQLRWEAPVWESLGFKFWVPEEELGGRNKIYMVALDPATGSGNDYSAIEVFDFPGLNQIAEYRTNTVNIPLLYSKLSWLLRKLSSVVDTGRGEVGRAEVLWTFERNGIGEALSALYYNDEKQVQDVELVNDNPSKFGVFTSGRQKVLSALQLKSLVERVSAGGINIKSQDLIFELKHFVSKGNGYEAKLGATDDNVMATILIMRLLKRLSEYNEEAFVKVNEYVDPDASIDQNNDYVPFAML